MLSSQPIQRTRASARAERAETVSVWLRLAQTGKELLRQGAPVDQRRRWRHLSRPAHGSACRPGPSVLVVDHNNTYQRNQLLRNGFQCTRAQPLSDPGNGESNPGQRESCPIRGDDPGRYESGEVASLCARPGRPVQCAGQVVVIVFPRSREGLASPTMRCYPRSRCHLYLDAPVRRMHYVTVT